jgi:bifunctional non-homologous end joining protein LigD
VSTPERLAKYRRMRQFDETPEPSGKARRPKAKEKIFVVQKHDASHLHYDFRLEMEGVLKSWAVPKGPSYDPAVRRLAMMTEDHPYEYASFEGVIPEGNYGAGNVIVWDEGTWEFAGQGKDEIAALKKGKLTFRLHGRKLFGEWTLVKKSSGRNPRGNEWLLIKHRDGYANQEVDVTEVAPMSVVSGRSVDDVAGAEWESNRKSAGNRVKSVAEELKEKKKKAPARRAAPRKSPAKGAAAKTPARKSGAGGTKKSPNAAATTARTRSARRA